ncbi:hypothetical protein C7T94_09385 [Pedobacter yulinensis]|uniref:DUF4374 domain-containing protein n=1 Tax=Pedobacter yulinensis TaxID=2126353 RepID=A0A2T3HK74_9SPHI|nr:DUF4374 domain-containing protein [Pedobacter yulinensis]PST82842.1 hypothetical protein C7T94_09385 [Pedobacter yulinensis]
MKLKFTKAIILAMVASVSLSCKKDNGNSRETRGPYVLAVTPVAATAVADYLVNASSLDEGSITTENNGLEQDGSYRYYVTHNNKFFSMLYGQSNPGAVTTYNLLDGKLNKVSNFQTETVQAFAPVNSDILLMKIPRAITNPLANWYRVNTNSLLISGEGTVNVQDLSKNGESAFFSWIKQVGNKVYAPYFSIKACCGAAFDTNFPDNAWIAVYSYPEMQLEKVIQDDRTSFIGRYFTDGLGLTENGDVYAFSSSVATNNKVLTSTKPSAITRIKAGTTEFDQGYFLNFETASGGMVITNWLYIGNDNFVVTAIEKAQRGAYTVGNRIGILNVANKTFKLAAGMPAPDQISSISANNYTPKNGRTAYVGVNMKDGSSYVYKIDAANQTAARGLKVEGGTIAAIQFLN